MIRQPEWGTRNVNRYFYESEARRIAALNEIFGNVELTAEEMQTLVWLCGWEACTVENVLSAIRKAMAAEAAAPSVGRKSPRQSAKAAFDRAEPVKSAFALLSVKVTKPMHRIRR